MKKILAVVIVLLVVMVSINAYATGCNPGAVIQVKGLYLSGAIKPATDTFKLVYSKDTATYDATVKQYVTGSTIFAEETGTGYTAGGYAFSTQPTVTIVGTAGILDFPDMSQANGSTGVTFDAPATCTLIYDATLSNSVCTAPGTPYVCCSGNNAGTCTNSIVWIGSNQSMQPVAATINWIAPAPDATHAVQVIQ